MNPEKIRLQLREFNAIYMEIGAIYSDLAKKGGLSDCAFWLMYFIREANGEFTQKEICGQWTMSKQTVNSALKNLENSGYIILTPSKSDKRSKYITLTEKGTKFAQKNIDIIFELEQLTLQKMSDTERTVMIESNRKYQVLLRTETERFLKNNC